MVEEQGAISLDLHGAICPEPIQKVMQAISQARPGQRVEGVVDFSPAVLTITSIVTRQPWDISVQGTAPGVWRITLTPRPASAR